MASSGNNTVSLDKRYEIFQDYIKTVLNLSTGALVLSITFLHEIIGVGSEHGAHPLRYGCLLGISWVSFLVSVLGCLFYLYFLALASNGQRNCSKQLVGGALAGVGGFCLGLIFFAVFGWINLA
jgi:FtsH-binding integral membrane protein